MLFINIRFVINTLYLTEVIADLYAGDSITNEHWPINSEIYQIIQSNAVKLESAILYDRDFDYISYATLKILKSYHLLNGKIVERPHHMLMRVAVGIHGENIDSY